MNFRSTSFALNQQAIRHISRLNGSLLKYQNQISSGFRIERPSDDPVAMRQITSLSARLEELRSETETIKDAETKLNTSVSQLTETNNLLTTAKVLAQQGIQALSDAERNALAVEAESLLANLQSISETQIAGAYLYGGTKTNAKPFTFSDPLVPGGTLNTQYVGAAQNSTALVGESVTVDTYYAGSHVFANRDRGETVVFGNSGAASGPGTDNLIGRATLQVRHTSTTYLGGSGIATGIDSADGDTVLGQIGQHTLTINDTSGTGASGTISLNGGPEVAFSNTDTNLEVPGSDGQKVFVDTTSITAGFNGTIDLTADGTISVDGGLTTQPITFSADQTVTDSTSGRFAHIDSQSISQTGDDYLEFPGTSDAFQVVYELVQDLRNTRGLENADIAAALDRRLGELNAVADHVLDTMGYQAASLQTLQQLDFRIQDLSLETETQLNNLQATDVAETVLRMQNDQNLLQYTYAVTAQLNAVGLIDFLR